MGPRAMAYSQSHQAGGWEQACFHGHPSPPPDCVLPLTHWTSLHENTLRKASSASRAIHVLREHRVKASSIMRPLGGRLSKGSSCVCSNYRASPGLQVTWVPWLRQPPLPPRAGFISAGAPCSVGHSATGDSDDSAVESGTGESVPRAQHSRAAHPCWDLCQQPGHRPALPRGKECSPSWLPLPGDPTCALGFTSRVVPGAGASSLAHTCPLVTVLPARRTPPHATAWGPTGDTAIYLGQSLHNSESSQVCVLSLCHKGSRAGTFGFLLLLNGLAKCAIPRDAQMDAADMGLYRWATFGPHGRGFS